MPVVEDERSHVRNDVQKILEIFTQVGGAHNVLIEYIYIHMRMPNLVNEESSAFGAFEHSKRVGGSGAFDFARQVGRSDTDEVALGQKPQLFEQVSIQLGHSCLARPGISCQNMCALRHGMYWIVQ